MSSYWDRWERAGGALPAPCHFCSEPVQHRMYETVDGQMRLTGARGRSAVLHHLDEDRSNNDPSNLVLAHHACHTAHHRQVLSR